MLHTGGGEVGGTREPRRRVAILGEIALQAGALEPKARHLGLEFAVAEVCRRCGSGAAPLVPLSLQRVLQAAALIPLLLQASL